jgi:hypothetical protein
MRTVGSKGGNSTLERHGREHYRKNGLAVLEKHGREHFRKLALDREANKRMAKFIVDNLNTDE